MVIVFADVSQDERRNRTVQIMTDEFGGHFIRQMPSPAHHPLFNGPRVRADAEHFQIVIRFQEQHVGAPQMYPEGIGYVAKICYDRNFNAVGGERKSDRIDSIVGHCKTRYVEVAYRERATRLEALESRLTLAPLDKLRCAMRHINRHTPFAGSMLGECSYSGSMISVLMSKQYPVDRGEIFSNGSKPFRDFAPAQARVD